MQMTSSLSGEVGDCILVLCVCGDAKLVENGAYLSSELGNKRTQVATLQIHRASGRPRELHPRSHEQTNPKSGSQGYTSGCLSAYLIYRQPIQSIVHNESRQRAPAQARQATIAYGRSRRLRHSPLSRDQTLRVMHNLRPACFKDTRGRIQWGPRSPQAYNGRTSLSPLNCRMW